MKMPKLSKPAIIILIGIILLSVGIAAAVIYKLQESNKVTVTVTETVTPIPVTLSPSAMEINEGEQLTLTATATGPNAAYANAKTVTFMEGTTNIGTAEFQKVGDFYKATYTFAPSAGTHTYHTAADP